jgi:outer membrane protein OmpA-like peptidoglycan-associated protein
LRILPTLAALCLAAVPALAQAPGMSVDYGALDSTAPPAPAPSDTAPVVLKPPLAPVVLTPPPAPKRTVMIVPPPAPPAKATTPQPVTPVRAPAPMPPAPAAPQIPPAAAPALVAPPAAPAAPQATPAATPAVAAPQAVPGAPKPTPVVAPAVAAGPAAMVRFAKADSALSPDGRGMLDRVAAALAANDKLRLVLVAHASGDPDDPVLARRVSLQRAIAARTYLMEHGVQSVRMDVRALGDKDAGDGPIDRVDLVLVER